MTSVAIRPIKVLLSNMLKRNKVRTSVKNTVGRNYHNFRFFAKRAKAIITGVCVCGGGGGGGRERAS